MRAAALLCVGVLFTACSDSKPAPVAVSLEEPSQASSQVTSQAKPVEAISIGRVPEVSGQRENTVPSELAEFGIQAPLPALDDLRDKAKEQIGPNNADAELDKLRAELGDKQP